MAPAAGKLGAGKLGIVDLERAAAHIRTLPAGAKGAVLAAHATPEGHWKFVNRDGDVFTAGTPEELQRVVPTLLPDAAPPAATSASTSARRRCSAIARC